MTKIVISSWWFPVCPALYLQRAARRMGLEVRTVGPTNGDRIDPWESPVVFPGMGFAPDVVLPDHADPSGSWRRVQNLAMWADVWIDVDGGWFLEGDVPAKRRVLVATDPHCASICPRNSYSTQRGFVKTRNTYVMQSNHCRPGEKWLPYAFDPEWFFPEDVPQAVDVTNLGAPYPHRVEISDALHAAGLRVLGPGRTEIGDAHRRELCSAPVAIVWPMTDDLPCRVFEALACGRVVVTKMVDDLRRLHADGAIDVRNVSTCVTQDGLVDFVRREHASLSFAGGSDISRHTWDARLAQLIEGRAAP